MNRRFYKLKLKSYDLDSLVGELDYIEHDSKTSEFANRKETYECPECLYLGSTCDRCTR